MRQIHVEAQTLDGCDGCVYYIKYGEILSFACRVNVMKLTGG